MNSVERIDRVESAPVLGQRYLVPTILHRWGGITDTWPVLLPLHRDALINFDYEHWHVDARFTSQNQDALARTWIKRIMPVLEARDLLVPLDNERLLPEAGRSVALLAHGNEPLCLEPTWVERTCRRAFSPSQIRCERIERLLHVAFGETPKAIEHGGRFYCPHHGADITHVCNNSDGTRTCPMHGLRVAI